MRIYRPDLDEKTYQNMFNKCCGMDKTALLNWAHCTLQERPGYGQSEQSSGREVPLLPGISNDQESCREKRFFHDYIKFIKYEQATATTAHCKFCDHLG